MSEAIKKDLEFLERVKEKNAYKARKAQELEIQLAFKLQQDEEKARQRALKEELRAREREKEIAAREALAKEKAAKRAEEMEAFTLEQERLAEEREREKKEREKIRAAAIEKQRQEEAAERRRQAEIAKQRIAAAKEAQERERVAKEEYAQLKAQSAEVKLKEFKVKIELRHREAKRKGELKEMEVVEARSRVAAQLEAIKIATEEKARIAELRMQELERKAEEELHQREEARKAREIVLAQKKEQAARNEEEHIESILARQALVAPRIEAAARRREKQIEELAVEAEKKHQHVVEKLRVQKDKDKARQAEVRSTSQKKVDRCNDFLDQKRELLTMRSTFKHDTLKAKSGWSLLSTQKSMQEQQQLEFAKLKEELLRDAGSTKAKSDCGDAYKRTRSSRSDPGSERRRLKGTSLVQYCLPPFALPPPVQRFASLLTAGVPYAHKYGVYDVYVPGEPATFTVPVSPREDDTEGIVQ